MLCSAEGASVISIIREAATMTAKGRITLPKTVRQALGVDVGAKVTFELHEDGQVVVSGADAEHEDPAIGAFLDLLADDIRAGRHVGAIPADLEQAMLHYAARQEGRSEDIDGDVDL